MQSTEITLNTSLIPEDAIKEIVTTCMWQQSIREDPSNIEHVRSMILNQSRTKNVLEESDKYHAST